MNTQLTVICLLSDSLCESATNLAKSMPSNAVTINQAVAALQTDAAQLPKAWSEMAIRNLLADMLRSVRRINTAIASSKVRSRSGAISGGSPPATGRARSNAVTGTAPVIPTRSRATAVTGVNPYLSSTCQEVCEDLIKRIDAELKQHSPSIARYGQVVCFGYKTKVVADQGYSGSADDASDMLNKCNDMKVAIRAAYALADQNGRNLNSKKNVLKVFVAPEFFFRGLNGAYDHAVVHGGEQQTDATGKVVRQRHKGLADIMLEEVGRPEYNDWLFVLGTAIAATKLTETACLQPGCKGPVTFDLNPATNKTTPRCSVDATHKTGETTIGAQVENVGLIIKEKTVHTVSKELVSHIDYIANKALNMKDEVRVRGERLPVARYPQPSGYNAATNVPAKFSDERMGGCIFTIDGVTIGIEVCLDHAASVGSDNQGRLNHAGNIQLQIIPSAGMKIGSLRTIPGGVVFNVDGLTPHVQAVANAQLVTQQDGYSGKGGAGGPIVFWGPFNLPSP